MRLALQQITLVAIDTRAPALAAQSLLHSMAGIDFGRVMLFTHDWVPRRVLPGIELVEIPPISSGAEYSHFVMRRLPAYIKTSHVLVTQWDGFVIEPRAWRSEFLVHDYVGAVWPDQPAGRNVGNGGFSLRSRRFLAAGLDLRITDSHPEDEVLCRTQREFLEREHGVRFAPPELARRFAYENESPGDVVFGFHGPYHLPRFLDEGTLLRWMQALPEAFFLTRDARRLARAALRAGMPRLVQAVVARRQAAGRHETSTALMSALASVLGRFDRQPG
jgi:hypothetical protein